MTDTFHTVPKMIIASGSGIAISAAEVETTLRILSIVVTMGLSVAVYIRDSRRKAKSDKEDGSSTDK